ncbi:MAG: anthranilate synthase component II [Planctomycetota bacterium]|jgi:anthranilate synthase component 2/para-aminobenzoate synthetase component 2
MAPHVFLLDNYDSFTFNLVQALRELGAEVTVERNDQITVAAALALEPTHVVVSPGPGRPEAAGIALALIEASIERLPVLGVCLGHQSLAMVLGGTVERAPRCMHGKPSPVYHDGRTLYQGLPNPFEAGRYHSLCVPEGGVPDSCEVSSYTSDGEVMGIRHKTLPVEGVQFHPESVLTPEGNRLLGNFLALQGAGAGAER